MPTNKVKVSSLTPQPISMSASRLPMLRLLSLIAGWLSRMLNRSSEPSWLSQMRKYSGQSCPTGGPPTPLMRRAFERTNFGDLGAKTPPACAAGLNLVLEECGLLGTNSAAADSFLKYGEPTQLRPGAILVFRWANGEHHVTLCEEAPTDESTVACLGFNQNHKVQLAVYSQRWIEGIRWPLAPR